MVDHDALASAEGGPRRTNTLAWALPGEMTAGQVARELGVSARTVHTLEAKGTLLPVRRSSGGYRLYRRADVADLKRALATVGGSGTDDVLTVADVLRLPGVSRGALRRWEEWGYLVPAYRTPGGWRRYRRTDVEALQRARPGPPACPDHTLLLQLAVTVKPGLTLAEMAKAGDEPPSAVFPLLAGLRRNGLVEERAVTTQGGRRGLWRVTDAGRRAVAEAAA